ncbi:MAG TPA: hypothetical protein VK921_02240, partial [Anditalea sp.]|nr:hypothetical protein [Anditalea sp.]
MDITIKYRIISEIIKSDDEQVLNAVKSLLNIEDPIDFWDEMSEEDREAIDEGLEQLEILNHYVRDEIIEKFDF